MKIPKLLIELKPSKIHKGGVGVFAVARVKKGEKVAEGINKRYYKKIIPWKEFKNLDKKNQDKVMAFCIGTPKGFIPPENGNFNYLSNEWYFNHSCDGNLGFDKEGDFIAVRDIKNREELSYDYGLVESNPKFKMKCTCGSRTCRKIITGNDWKDPVFRKKHLKFMYPFLPEFPLSA